MLLYKKLIKRGFIYKRPLCVMACVALVVVFVLVTGTSLFSERKPPPLEEKVKPRENITLTGQVYNQEIRNQNHVIHLKNLRLSDETIIPKSRVIVYVNKEEVSLNTLKIGDQVLVSGALFFFDEGRNPGNFNQRRHFHKQGIHGRMFVEQVHIVSDSTKRLFSSLRSYLISLKYAWMEVLFDNLGEEHGGLMASILLGEKSALDQETKRMYQKNGISHILVISGLHMSFIGVGLYRILRKCGASFLVAGFMGTWFLILYTLMIGLGVSSFRALLMFAIKMGAEILGRKYDGANSLAIASMAFLLWRPTFINEPGFLLSFGAVLSIVMIMPMLTKIFVGKREKKWKKNIKKAFILNLSIYLMILPVIVTFFFEFPLYTLLINVLVVALMAFLLGAGLLASLLYVILPILGQGGFMICRWILGFYEGLCEFFIHLPGSRIVTGQPEAWQVVMYYSLLFLLCLYMWCMTKDKSTNMEKVKEKGKGVGRILACFGCRNLENKWRDKFKKSVVVSLLFLSMLFFVFFPFGGLDKELTITMIDVGQGDGIFIRDPKGRTYLIDGGSSNVSSVGLFRMEPFLLSQGIRQIDYAFISHGDDDHYNGTVEMLENQRLGVRIKNLVVPVEEHQDENIMEIIKVAQENNTLVLMMGKGQKIRNGDFVIKCIGPKSRFTGKGKNDASMVLSLSYHNFSMLFTGDIEEAGERALVMEGDLKHHTILKVAHHGSRTSSDPSFLEQVNPRIALISAGQNNRFNHPSPEVVERLKFFESKIFVTKDVGGITVKTDGNKVRVNPYIQASMLSQVGLGKKSLCFHR